MSGGGFSGWGFLCSALALSFDSCSLLMTLTDFQYYLRNAKVVPAVGFEEETEEDLPFKIVRLGL